MTSAPEGSWVMPDQSKQGLHLWPEVLTLLPKLPSEALPPPSAPGLSMKASLLVMLSGPGQASGPQAETEGVPQDNVCMRQPGEVEEGACKWDQGRCPWTQKAKSGQGQ